MPSRNGQARRYSLPLRKASVSCVSGGDAWARRRTSRGRWRRTTASPAHDEDGDGRDDGDGEQRRRRRSQGREAVGAAGAGRAAPARGRRGRARGVGAGGGRMDMGRDVPRGQGAARRGVGRRAARGRGGARSRCATAGLGRRDREALHDRRALGAADPVDEGLGRRRPASPLRHQVLEAPVLVAAADHVLQRRDARSRRAAASRSSVPAM